jgi:hypothetical protein
MPDRFPTFEVILKKRGRKWRWCVCTIEGMAIMQGSEGNRTAAKYQADRALFLLLLAAPYRLHRLPSLDIRDAASGGYGEFERQQLLSSAEPTRQPKRPRNSWRTRPA